jgi:hypothetical protein
VTTTLTSPPHTSLPAELQATTAYILGIQMSDGAIPWYSGGKLDPWDHTEAAMALSIAGQHSAAERAYHWLAQQQLDDGSWYANYFPGAALHQHSTAHRELRETNFVAYVATGVWHHFLITRDQRFLAAMFPCVRRAVEFVLRYQSEFGEIAWAVDVDGNGQNDALVTACSSILRSLDCACHIARILGKPWKEWKAAADRLAEALLTKPERFDRTWESKARFSMDWYYPVLAGLYTENEARQRLAARWHQFVEPAIGCRCVSDEPWVTMAETSELVIALVASGEREKARQLYEALHQWRDSDGGYWTGYVFRDETIWPAEKTTWTAGAVLLAADALFSLTPAHGLFLNSRQSGDDNA